MYPVEHIWTILMLKILQAHLLPAFVANSKIDAIYALYLESFCDKILLSGKFSLFLTLIELSLASQKEGPHFDSIRCVPKKSHVAIESSIV